MKNFKQGKNRLDFLEDIQYDDINTLKQLIRNISTSNLSNNSSTVCITADIKQLIKTPGLLTPKQQFVVTEYLILDKPQQEIANTINTSQQNVSLILKSALTRIQSYLRTNKINWIKWSQQEQDFLIQNYGFMDVHEIANKLGKPVSRVVSMYHYLKRK